MKREYSKPTIHVEILALDMPVAGSCGAQSGYTEYGELIEQGWLFVSKDSCAGTGDGLYFGDAEDEMAEIGDTLCYHSAVTTIIAS